ncbi:MAG TPA: methionine--tRNA ligase [Polyangiales bacterium]|nr:methionine--tRNA ligase [Polyangiales bacterium]
MSLYITTAIPFVNARPHLGFALELCITDAIARHARARGSSVQLVSGTDDHSLKNVLAAERAGRTTHAFVTEQAQLFQQLAAALEISVDRFVQTSQSEDHRPAVYALWRACEARGDLFRKPYRGLYCVGCERFAEPGEQRCPEHATLLEWVEETNWFFRLPRYAELIRSKIESGELDISNTGAREETLAFLREPLRDLCVSRSAQRARGWGLPVPGDPSQVIWVWFDALAYYLSALRHAAADGGDVTQFWENAQRLHVIGKGVTRFHAVFWPAILASAGLALPSELLVHGYLTLDGVKISKSGRSLDPFPLIEQYGVDALRYYLLRHVRTGRDGDFSQERFIQAYNAELANGLGNLANRLLGLLQRATQGVLPEVSEPPPECATLHAQTLQLRTRVAEALDARELDTALDNIFELIAAANRCIDQTAPWSLIKTGSIASATRILRSLFETLSAISVELAPFLPKTARDLGRALHLTPEGKLHTKATLPPSLTLFPRILRDTSNAESIS